MRFLLYLVSLLVFSSLANALTIYEVIEKVVNNSPELRIIFEKKTQAVETYNDQKSSYLPKIYAIFNKEFQKDDPITSSAESSWTDVNKLQLMIEQRIYDVEQMTKILRSAQSVQTQEFENQKLLESLIQLAVISYYDVIQSEYIYSVNQEYLRQLKEIEALTLDMRAKGVGTLSDLNYVQSRVANATSSMLMAQANLEKVRLRLAYLLNLVTKDQLLQSSAALPELTNKDFYDLADKIVGVLPATPDDLINDVLDNNIDILLLRSNLCIANYDIEGQKARYLPTVNFTGELRSEESRGNASYTRYGKFALEARYSIYDGGGRVAGVKKYSSALHELEYQYDVLVRDTSDKAFSTFNLLRSYEQQRLSVLKEIENTEEVDRIYKVQFEFASRNLIDRVDNLERLRDSRLQLVNLDYSILIGRLQVLMLMGSFVEFFGFENYLEASKLRLC